MDTILSVPQSPLPTVYYQPDQAILDKDKTHEWYMNNARYISTFYNIPQNIYDPTDKYISLGQAEQMFRLFSYYKGQQPNVAFKHTTMDYFNNEIPAVWIKGQEISQLVNFALGVATSMINNIEWSCKSLSDKSAKEWEDISLKLKVALALKRTFEQQGVFDVKYNPVEGADVDDEDDIDDFMSKYKNESEISAIKIANALYESDFLKNTYLRGMLHTLVGGLSAIYTYVENGRVCNEHKQCYNTIWDNRHDDYYNRQAQFCGFIDRLTPPELYLKYPELGANKGIRTEIEAMAQQQTGWNEFMSYYNTGFNNLQWWNYNSNRMTVGVATVFWIGLRDTRLIKGNNKYGNERYNKQNKPDEPGDYWTADIYKATIVGNKYCVDYGLMDNVVRDYRNKSNPMLPIRIFIPEMEMGEGRSLVARGVNNQNEMDRLKYKIQEKTGNDLGKTYIINGNRLGAPESAGVYGLLNDLKKMKVHVANISGEANDATDRQPIVETIDMSLDPNINRYIDLYHEQERILHRIWNYSDVSLGLQTRTIGKAVQEQSISQSSTGTVSLYDGYMEYIRQHMQYCLNTWKLVNVSDEEDNESLIVGKDGVQTLKLTKDFRWEDLLLFIEPNDTFDKESKARIQSLALAQAQNDRIDTIDYIEHIELATGKREMIKGLKLARKKRIKEMQAQEMKQQQAQEVLQQQALVSQQQAIVLQKQGEMLKTIEEANAKGAWAYKTAIDKEAAKLQSGVDSQIATAIINDIPPLSEVLSQTGQQEPQEQMEEEQQGQIQPPIQGAQEA